ncbi:MAG: gliding motility protein GldL [Flavobacteriaceae bacterium]|nr:MAG: gliding motility protein GldL [Flavobacteriaceae bacterium]
MAQSKTVKKAFNMAYNFGAAIVILGALFKILHWKVDIAGVTIGGGTLLAVGLIAEAFIFFISAFESVDDDLDWALVYPELSGGSQRAKDRSQANEAQGLLSQKLDDMLIEAKLDAKVMSSLSTSIMNFKGAAENIAPAIDSIAATNKYSEQLSLAAAQMESLNSLYKVQLESTSRQTDINSRFAGNAEKLQTQMEALTNNLSSLNGVYGGMLTAMSSKN